MVISAGLVIIYKSRILLINPKGKKFSGYYSIPKGMVEDGEDTLDAAIREVYEETGLNIRPEDIYHRRKHVNYYNLHNKALFKKIYYYFCYLSENENLPIVLPKDQLQESEVKYAAFFTKEEASFIIHWRQQQILYQF